MNRWRGRVVGVLLAGLLSAVAFADDPGEQPRSTHVLQAHGPAALSTTSPVSGGRMTVAFTDEIGLTVQVAGPSSLQVKPPQIWAADPWHVSRVDPPQVEQTGDTVRWSQRFWLEPLTPGETMLELAPLQYREKNGPWQRVAWQPITVVVSARLKQPEAASARDITSIEELPGLAGRESAWWIAAAGAGAALAGVIAWRWLRKRGAAPARSPEAWALIELDRLAALRLGERGKSERLATLLAGLVRRYLEKKFRVPARRQTTAEFLAALPSGLAEQRPWLEAFLTRCDQIKFAPIEVHEEECCRLVAEVRQHFTASGAAAA
jgi:hypothetical protein